MPRLALLVPGLLLLTGGVFAGEDEWGGDVEFNPTGVWHSEKQDVVVRQTGRTTWLGYPTEKGGVSAGLTWYFASTGEHTVRFWIMQEGSATTSKLAEQELDLSENPDEMTIVLPGRKRTTVKTVMHRIYAPLPKKVGDVDISFLPAGRTRIGPDQDVDVRLARLFRRAIAAAAAADPDLKRVNVCATIDQNVGLSKRHSRFIRQAVAIDKINGANAQHWADDVNAHLRAFKAGESPAADPRRQYARHVAAVILGFMMQEGTDEVVCPTVLDSHTVPYLEWWIGKWGRSLPEGGLSVVTAGEKFEAMLDSTRGARARMKLLLFISVANREDVKCTHRKSKEKRYDRE